MSITIFIDELMEEESLTLNLSNGNFKTFMIDSLKINLPGNDDPTTFGPSFDCGEIQPRYLLQKLNELEYLPELSIRNELRNGNFISCALTLGQVTRYISKLKEICEVAMKAEKLILWA